MAIISKKVAAKLLCIDKVNAFRMFLSEWEINFIIGTMTRIVDRKHSFLSDKQIAIIDKLYHKMEAEDILNGEFGEEDFLTDKRIEHVK